MTEGGIVKEIGVNNRVKTDTRPRKFRPLLKLIKPSMTSMNSNDILQIYRIQKTRFRSITECF